MKKFSCLLLIVIGLAIGFMGISTGVIFMSIIGIAVILLGLLTAWKGEEWR